MNIKHTLARMLNQTLLSLVALAVLTAAPLHVQAMDIKANEWQLISFPRLPQNATIESVFGEAATATNKKLTSVWTFDNNNKAWQSWPSQAGLASSNLSELTLGQGYWVKSNADITLDLSDATQAVGEMVLYPGWNLIGLSIDQTMGHEQAMAGVPFLELWKYDSSQNAFSAVEKSRGSQIILKEEFTDIEAGTGLWVYMAEQSTLLPSMGTLLPPDIDIEPLLNLTEYGVATSWNNVTPGDVDWDEDGFFDFPNTQHVLSFGDFLNRQRLSITNEGNGVLSWQATIEPAVDWLLFEAFDEDQQPVLTNFAVGNVSSTNGELVLVANRTGMAPSDNYKTQIVLRANGSTQEKRIDVNLAVADVVGDYEMTVRLDDVNGKAADLHNPKYFLSFAKDGDGVKAFLDEERSLLIPQITYLSGDYIADPESHFQVLGQLYLPADHAHNPYENDIRREFTIIGQRSDGKDGLSPLDLKGTYAENIYGIFDDPIQLKGEFVARRLSPNPKKKDQSISDSIQGEILAGSAETPSSTVFDLNITDRYSITDVQTALSIEHPQPEALTLKLTGPAWVNDKDETVRTTVVLHENQSRSLKDVRFDEYDPAIGSLDSFDGQISFGQWTLEVINASTSVGDLNSWVMDISGAKVYTLSGTLPDAGIKIQISGCGIVASTVTNESGYFEFDGLIPCDYELKVLQLGYEITTTDVRIIGCMQDEVCNTQAQYTQTLTTAQLTELEPQLVTSSGAMKVLVSPETGLLPITLQAVDVTDYSQLDKTLQSRTWQLFKKINNTTAISEDGYLIDVQPKVGEVQYGKNYFSYSEDYTKWKPNHRVSLVYSDAVDPRGGFSAVQATVIEQGYPSLGASYLWGDGGFPVNVGDKVTLSVFLKELATKELRFRFASEKGFVADKVLNFITGEKTGGGNLSSNVQSLANGWYRAEVTYQVTESHNNFYTEMLVAKNGTPNDVPVGSSIMLFGPQIEVSTENGRVNYRGLDNKMRSPFNPEGWTYNAGYNLVTNTDFPNPSGSTVIGLVERIVETEAAGTMVSGSHGSTIKSGDVFYLAVIAKSITSDNSFRMRFNDAESFLGSVSINIDTGVRFSGGAGNINQTWQVTDLANGFKLFETKMTVHRDSSDLWAQIIFEKKDGSVQGPPLGSKAYVQAAFFGKANDWPAKYTPPKPLNEITASAYIPTGANHTERSIDGQQEVLIAEQTTGLSGSFSHKFANLRSNAGVYYVKLSSDVKNTANVAETISYSTQNILAQKNPEAIHVGAYSVFGAGGSTSLKAMGSATFDIDRFPLMSETGSQGIEDSDGFKPDDIEGDAYETNAPNDVSKISTDPDVYVVTPTGIDAPAGNLNKHYKMYISAGQLYQGGSMYSGGVRLDVGIQSQEESK